MDESEKAREHDGPAAPAQAGKTAQDGKTPLVRVYEHRPAGYDGTCLRPLGLCELGGACDTCWYSPTHPRHRQDPPG